MGYVEYLFINIVSWSNPALSDRLLSRGQIELFDIKIVHKLMTWGCPHGVMVKAMDCGIVVSEFVLQSRYYVHFLANTHGKVMNPLILPAMG